ncbi:MAG: 50S ribosomal protein L25 [Candidatus Aminicenantia bacterium]
MEEILLKVELREKKGKEYSKKLRRQGKIPGIIYGADFSPLPVEVSLKDIHQIIKKGENFIFKLHTGKEKLDVLLKDFQRDPVKREILHVDFYKVSFDKPVRVKIPIVLEGKAVGVEKGGFLDFAHRELELECLPKYIPDNIVVDISSLDIGDSIKIQDLKLPEELKVITEPETVIAFVEVPLMEEAAPVPSEEIKEPEVIKKGKEEKEEEE